MQVVSDHHQHGETICRVDFSVEYESIREILEALEPPLYPAGEFTDRGRPLKPKRHMRSIGGTSLPALLPVDQTTMNHVLKHRFVAEGWRPEPVAAGSMVGPNTPLNLKGDFVRREVFVEIEFGNVASMHRDFFKFQIANRSGAGQVGVLVVATERFAKFFDTNVATFETAVRSKPYLAIGIQMPLWIVGIEPSDFHSAIGVRYEEMRAVCQRNGVECHPFDAALGASLDLGDVSGDPQRDL